MEILNEGTLTIFAMTANAVLNVLPYIKNKIKSH